MYKFFSLTSDALYKFFHQLVIFHLTSMHSIPTCISMRFYNDNHTTIKRDHYPNSPPTSTFNQPNTSTTTDTSDKNTSKKLTGKRQHTKQVRFRTNICTPTKRTVRRSHLREHHSSWVSEKTFKFLVSPTQKKKHLIKLSKQLTVKKTRRVSYQQFCPHLRPQPKQTNQEPKAPKHTFKIRKHISKQRHNLSAASKKPLPHATRYQKRYLH